MRRYLNFLSAGLALALLVGCAPGDSEPPTPTTTPAPTVVNELHLTREIFPKLDGSTSTAPLARAVCSALLGESVEQVGDLVCFSKTTQSYRSLMNGQADLLIAAEPSETVLAEKERAAYFWDMAPVATDALVFLVNEDNPVESLTAEQVRKIYTGEITNWAQVGGKSMEITPFQRNAEAGSQTLMKKLVMGDLELMEAPTQQIVGSMEGLVEAVRSFDGSPSAIGYTVYYYANDMNMAEGLKTIAIDGAAPSAKSIRSGAYPFTNPYYAVIPTAAAPDSPARQVYDWLQGPVGQSLIAHEGYVSILEDVARVEWDLGETAPVPEKYTRLSDGALPELIPAGDYGPLLTYVGSRAQGEWGDYDIFGLVTRQGMIVTDPVYQSAWQLNYYNDKTGLMERMNLLSLGRSVDGEERYALAAGDGSWVTGFGYASVSAVDSGRVWVTLADGTGVMLNAEGEELWRIGLTDLEDPYQYRGMEGSFYWSDGIGYSCADWFLDGSTHKIVDGEGRWECVQAFSSGRGMAQNSEGLWGYINSKGDWIIQPIYTEARAFADGKAVVRAQTGAYLVIDANGQVLLDSAEKLTYITDGAYFVRYTEDQNFAMSILEVYDRDARSIASPLTGQTVQSGSGKWYWNNDETGVCLYSAEESVHLDAGGGRVMNIDGELVTISQERAEEDTLYSVWRLDGARVLPAMTCDYAGVLTDSYTGTAYIYSHKNGRYTYYDEQGKRMLDVATNGWSGISEGLIEWYGDTAHGYLDLEGNWVFRISLMKTLGD